MIFLSFDIEEFDVPMEHGVQIPFDEQMAISVAGTTRILDCLKEHDIKATFFCTANFALNAKEIMARIVEQGNEVASHGFYHSTFSEADLASSKLTLEGIVGAPVTGYRQARMMPVSEQAIYDAGYKYNSSLNPTFIPGRYMHFNTPRLPFIKGGVLQIPASVTPIVRFPLFWLSYHNLPARLYRYLCGYTHRRDNHLVTYFHPWEFYELRERPDLKLPFIIRNNSGVAMVKRLGELIEYFKKKGVQFETLSQFTSTYTPKK